MIPCTPSQTVGPFFSFALDRPGGNELVGPDAPGALILGGVVLDGAGQPVPDAVVELWQADARGEFPDAPNAGVEARDEAGDDASEPPVGAWSGFGRCLTDVDGRYRFTTIKPGPVDGRQAPHIDVSIFARGLLQRLVTRVYFPDEPAANAADPLLAAVADPTRRATLVARAEDGGRGLRFDIVLQGDGETVFLAW